MFYNNSAYTTPFCTLMTFQRLKLVALVSQLHVQVRLMGNFGLNGSLPWLQNTDGAICFICKEDIESVTQFFFRLLLFQKQF